MVTLESLDKLTTPEGHRLLEIIREADPTPATAIATGARLRREWPAELVMAAMEMHGLRQAARAKFSQADRLWFTREGLEQATAEPVARWRSARFDSHRSMVDACCGIGGDLIAIATSEPRDAVMAIDRDPLHLAIARLNLEAAGGADHATFFEAEVQAVPIPSGAAVFIDPARRSERGRLATGESEPPLEWCVALAGSGRAVGIKFAPGIDHARVPDGWELETIAIGADLKEAVLWSPALARTGRTATVIDGNRPHQLIAVPGDPVAMRAPEPGDVLIDPNPAVTRAGLVADLARILGAAKIDEQIAFLVSSDPVDSPFGRSLHVIASLPWNEKALKRALRSLDAGPVDVRRRGLPGDVDAISRRLRGSGTRPLTVAMTRVRNEPWAIICETR
jgi:SAM-dependent methyltransferase